MKTFVDIASTTWNALPPVARGGLVILIGWLSAILVRALVRAILAISRFDTFADRVGIGQFLAKGKVSYRPGKLVSVLVYWIVIIATLIVASRVLDIVEVNNISDTLVKAMPSIIAAFFITIVGILFVSFLANVFETIARNAAVADASAVARVFRYVGFTIIILLAADQLGFGKGLLTSLILITFAAPALAFAIAFGLGSVDLAREVMENLLKKRSGKDQKSDLEE